MRHKNLKKFAFFLGIMFCFFFYSCKKDDDSNKITTRTTSTINNKIMPLGASRVEGSRPNYESFRYSLWKQLIDGGWMFDFIGTMKDGALYPEYLNRSFDIDYEGHKGYMSSQILSEIKGWLDEAGIPDIVLFSSPGGTDIVKSVVSSTVSYNEIINNINAIIDTIQSVNSEVTIIIEKLAPARPDMMILYPKTAELFDKIQKNIEIIANKQTTSTSKVIVVDIATGFKNSFYADIVHYNEKGAEFVADKYYLILETILK